MAVYVDRNSSECQQMFEFANLGGSVGAMYRTSPEYQGCLTGKEATFEEREAHALGTYANLGGPVGAMYKRMAVREGYNLAPLAGNAVALSQPKLDHARGPWGMKLPANLDQKYDFEYQGRTYSVTPRQVMASPNGTIQVTNEAGRIIGSVRPDFFAK